ncbi:MAG: T9SS type A sorting domain-containing protein [Flavobacteriales bacterium]
MSIFRTLALRFPLIAVLLAPQIACSQAGSLDESFNSADLGFENGHGANGMVRAVLLQPDGRVIIGGSFGRYNAFTADDLARVNTDGTLDTTFISGAMSTAGSVYAMALQPDGRVIIAGDFTSVQGVSRPCIARLMPDGSLDNTFAPDLGANGRIRSVSLEPSGKIIIGGEFTTYAGNARSCVARLMPDGSLDTSFDIGSGAGSGETSIVWMVNATSVQADGRVLAAGYFFTFNGADRRYLVRLNSDGSVDNSFSIGTGTNNTIYSIAVQPDGRTVIGGMFTSYDGTACAGITRLLTDGAIDPDFQPGSGIDGNVVAIELQPDGRMVVGGTFNTAMGVLRSNIARLDADGGLDTSFDPGPGIEEFYTWASVSSVAVRPDGHVVIGGDFSKYNHIFRQALVQAHADGAPDVQFNPRTGFNYYVDDIHVMPDARIVVVGGFNSYDEFSRSRIARLGSDGAVDTTFHTGEGMTNSGLSRVVVQPDGKLVCVGYMQFWDGSPHGRIIRLNSNGSIDSTFNSSIGANSGITAVALQPDGGILIAGSFTTYDSLPANKVARLMPDGSLDISFDVGTGTSGYVNTMALQADGRVLIGGNFTTFQGQPASRLVRLESDGSLDATFTASANNTVWTIAVQPDERVLIGGEFTAVNGVSRWMIARLQTDGSLDASFASMLNSAVKHIELTATGDMLISGAFTLVQGTPRRKVARLHSDGTLDPVYNAGIGAADEVRVIRELPDGKALIGGMFTSYDGIGRNYFARLLRDEPLSVSSTSDERSWTIFPNPSDGLFTLRASDLEVAVRWSVVDALGRTVKTSQNADCRIGCDIDLRAYPAGAYVLRVDGADRRWNTTLIVR